MRSTPRPETRVVHVNDPGGFDVYMGRAARRAKDTRCHERSIWANPFTGPGAVEKYERWVRNELVIGARVPGYERSISGLLALRGKRLACWCKDPHGRTARDRACHVDVIVKILGELESVEPSPQRPRGSGASAAAAARNRRRVAGGAA